MNAVSRFAVVPSAVLLALAAFAPAVGAAAPAVTAQVRLSALPATLANGPSGPLNRIAFDVAAFDPADPRSSVTCHYADATAYACASRADGPADDRGVRRITVTIPDFGRGPRATVRFRNAQGQADASVDVVNGSRIVHEIEAIAFPDGGATTTRGDGTEAPVTQLATIRATTVPALAAAPPLVVDCESVVAEWVDASATDPVFASRFGPMNGSLVPARPVLRGARVSRETLPEWLVTHPLGAVRVQFIAHYEVLHRALPCARRLLQR